MNGEKEGLENGEEEEEEEHVFYDKAKSFFDNISCESIDRAKGLVYRSFVMRKSVYVGGKRNDVFRF